jgi:RND superfamily putative drug exporter
LLVLTFQDGRLTGPLGYTSQGAAVLGAVVGAIAAVAAISALRSVAFAAAVAQERALGLEPPRVAVPLAASLTLPAAGAATLVVGAATVVLVGSDLATAKQLGLATASGLALVVLVRALLAPGLARLSQ